MVCCVGEADQPLGRSSRTTLSAAPWPSFITVTRTSRSDAAGRFDRAATVGNAGNDATGTMAMSGETRTENSGTTSSSVRFSPLKMLPS